MPEYDAVVVGSGPNGLAAAITLAQAGWSVLVVEGKDTIGGGTRTQELTLPGFYHDVCSAIHPLAMGSPFFSALNLKAHGLEFIQPTYACGHPFDDAPPVLMTQSLEETGATLGKDGQAYERLLRPYVENWDKLAQDILGPFPLLPEHPILLARFGLVALPSAKMIANLFFKGSRAKGFFAGAAAHSILDLNRLPSASFGVVLLAVGHAFGWPIPRGGSQAITNAMAAYLEALGGKIQTGMMVKDIDELPSSKVVLFNLTPRQIIQIAGKRLPEGYKRRLEKYRYGSGVFKVDWALREPIPWRDKELHGAGTVHLGGTFEEIAHSEHLVGKGKVSDRPFVLVAQQSHFDETRAPQGQHTGWAYCHVPNDFDGDMTEVIENQIERFAPGFRDVIVARHTFNTAEMERYNPNYIGGDINGGVQDLTQLFTRPVVKYNPYAMPAEGLYICSSSTPPGGGVHGMCGYHAARAVLKNRH